MAELASGDLTQTVQAVASELGGKPVTARQVAEAILRRHSEYGRAEVSWPPEPRAVAVQQWLDEARALFAHEAHDRLHGRIAILGTGLADPPSGRAMARAGLFHALSSALTPSLWDGLTPEGRARLSAIPILSPPDPALGLGASVGAIAYNDAGNLIAASRGPGWVVMTRSRRQEIAGGHAPDTIETLAFVPDGRLLVATGGDAGLVQVREGSESWMNSPGILAVGMPGGQPTVATADLTVRPLESGARRVLGEGPPAVVAAFAEQAPRLARADGRGTIEVWDLAANALVAAHDGDDARSAIAISGDGEAIVSIDVDGLVRLHDVSARSDRPIGQMFTHRRAAFSPGGQRMATAGRGTTLWDRTGSTVAARPHDSDVQAVAFSPNGEFLATGDDLGIVRIYAAGNGAQIAEIEQPAGVMSLAWSPDGEELAVGTESGSFTQLAATLEPPRRARLASYTPDDVDAATELAERQDIDDDVDAFAALVAATAVTPPLSIGLFGDWGSGKTFFMRRLNARVARLAADARESGELQRDVAWHKRIVQVEFNAWHYAEGNLWASLVEHILDNLSLSPDEPDDLVDKRKAKVLEEITTQRGASETAAAQLELTRKALETTEGLREELAEELAEVEAEDPLALSSPMPDVKAEVDRATHAIELPGGRAADEEPTIANLAGALDDARTVLQAGHRAATPLIYAPDRRRRFVALLAIVVGAPALAVLAGVLAPEVVQSLIAAATGIAAALGGAVAWVQRQLEWTRARLGDLDSAAQALDAPARELREEQERERSRLVADHEAATRTAAAAEARLRELEATIDATTPARMLAQLVADRAESDDYRRHLGVLALVRRDFEAMSQYLRLQAKQIDSCETLEQEEKDDVRVGRIVLYIDDLDRCEPKQVVAVLQAVHLLLAFPLFVVVVGVDMRWVEKSLKLRHQHLLASGDAAPRDYLEKIFQIPFWLEPLDADASKRMLRGLVGEAALAARPQAVRQASQPAASPAEPDAEAEPAAAGNGSRTLPEPDSAAPPHTPAPLPPSRQLLPESLDIEPLELTCMDELALLLGRSPRALKRFVNTYRLIKVRAADPAALVRADPPVAPYRALLFLLALCTGAPHAAAGFLDQVLGTATGRIGLLLEGKGEEASRIQAWLDDDASAPWRDLDVGALRPFAAEVVRFTFHWHAL